MNKKQVKTYLVIAGIMSSNISLSKATLVDEDIGHVLNDENNEYFDGDENLSEIENNEIEEESHFIDIKDKNLLKAINLYLNKDDLNAEVSIDDVLSIDTLDLSNHNISDISGLEYFTNLKSLNISNNNISDISKLSNLNKLENIDASYNRILDITYIETLNLAKADISNQTIYLEDITISENILNINNPVNVFDSLNMNYSISENGLFEKGVFIWDNLFLDRYDLEIGFEGNNEVYDFSGKIIQRVLKDETVFSDLKIEVDFNSENWVNSDLIVNYNILGSKFSSIEKIELPNENTTLNLSGNFKISSNGDYCIKVYLNNGNIIEKYFNIGNIDLDKPLINLSNKTIKDDIVTLEIEADDLLSGISYILMPNGEKMYTNKVVFSSTTDENICFTAFDVAGNSEILQVNLKDYKNKLPVINASNKKIALGSSFNPLIGVTAKDYKGYDISDKIIIVSNTVDTHSLGEYIVSYSVKDDDGYESTKSIIVEVIDVMHDTNNNASLNKEEILEILEEDNQNINHNSNDTKNNSESSLKDIYSIGIISAMLYGFRFLFKIGKDDF